MKILALNPFGTGNYDKAVATLLERAKRPDTEVEVQHLAKGPEFFRYWYFKALATPDIIERTIQAEKEGYDGVYIGCSYEPGVKEAREVVDIPVVGGAVPAVYFARQLGQKYGFITDTELAKVNTYDLFKRYRLDVECAGIEAVGLGAEEIPNALDKNWKRVVEIAEKMAAEGADVLVLGCTIVGAFFAQTEKPLPAGLEGIPFLDANVCSLKMLEALVDMREKFGITVTRRAYYAKPQDEEKEAFLRNRKIYGLS
jgi:allantoin racemase